MAELGDLNLSSEQLNEDDRTWGLVLYLLPLLALILLYSMPAKAARPFLRYHAIQVVGLMVSGLVLGLFTCGLGVVLWVGLSLAYGLKANNGDVFEIPFVTQFLLDKGYFEPVKHLTAGHE